MQKVLKVANRIFDFLLLLIFLSAAGVGVYIMIDSRSVYQGAKDYKELRNYLPEKEVSEEVLKEISGDAIAWITINESPIDYPILQSDNNMDYLSKDPEGNYSMAGSIFLDFRNRADFSDPYNIVYGHHMPNKLMFGALDDFSDPGYFEEHREGVLNLPDRNITFRTAAFLVVPAGSEEIFEPDSGIDLASFLAQRASIFYPEDLTARLAALTTCAEDDRFREVLILSLEE